MGIRWNIQLFSIHENFHHKKLREKVYTYMREKVYTYTLSHDCHLFLSGCCFHVHDSLLSHFSSLYSLYFLSFLFQNSSSSPLQSPMKSTEDKSCHSKCAQLSRVHACLSNLITHTLQLTCLPF